MLLLLFGCAINGGKPPVDDLAAPVETSHPIRLVLVGDTGKMGPVPTQISRAVTNEVTADVHRQTYVLALGDLFYPNPPVGAGCVEAVVERYQSYYGGIPADRVLAVAGNHDVSEQAEASTAAQACTEAAFQKMGWLKDAEPLQSRQVVLKDDSGKTPFSIEVDLIEAGFFSEQHPEVPMFSIGATWQIIATHYVLGASFGKGLDEQGQFYGMPQKMTSDLWINGHAHHLEARMVESRLAVTSGGGAEFRTVGGFLKELYQQAPSLFTYARCPEDATCTNQMAEGSLPPRLLPQTSQTGGYIILEFNAATPDDMAMTPVVCDVVGACVPQERYACHKVPEGRGVSCAKPASF